MNNDHDEEVRRAMTEKCKHGKDGYCFDCVRERHNEDDLDGRFDVETTPAVPTPAPSALELKPCPFCGSAPETGITGAPECDNWRYAKCSNNYCPIRYCLFTIKDWNTRVRADSGDGGALVGELQRELAFYFGQYHGVIDHRLDVLRCMENECVRVRKLLHVPGHEHRYYDAGTFKYGDGSIGCSEGQDYNDACGCKCVFQSVGERHPEDYCHKCGGPNIVWFAPSEIWNKAVREKGEPEILCPICFVQLAEQDGFQGAWRVANDHPSPSALAKERADSQRGFVNNVAAVLDGDDVEAFTALVMKAVQSPDLNSITRSALQSETEIRAQERADTWAKGATELREVMATCFDFKALERKLEKLREQFIARAAETKGE